MAAGSIPSPKELDDLSKEICDCWQSLGIQLGVELARIDCICNDHVQFPNLERKAFAMLKSWYDKGSGSTYCVLSEAFKKIGKARLAEKYCEASKSEDDSEYMCTAETDTSHDIEPRIPGTETEIQEQADVCQEQIHDKAVLEYFCKTCQKCICEKSTTETHRSHDLESCLPGTDAQLHEPADVCQEQFHDMAVLEYFCKTCQKCICQKCTILTHTSHDFECVKAAAEKAKRRLQDTENKVKQQNDLLEKQTNKDNDTRRKIKKQIEETRQAIQENSQRLVELVKRHEKQLLIEVNEFEEDSEKKFEDQAKNSKLRRELLNSITEYLRDVNQRADIDVLNSELPAMSQTQDVFDSLANYQPLKTLYIEYKPNEDVSRRLHNSPLGRVYNGLADPQKTQIQGLETNTICKGYQAQLTVVTKDTEDNICYSASEHVSVHILSLAGDEVETEVEDRKDGTYTVCFTPNTEGVHHVTVRVRGQSPANSPLEFHVTERRPRGYKAVATFGSRGSDKGQFKFPHGIAVNRAGEVAVSDGENLSKVQTRQRVQIFSADGRFLREFGTRGNADGQFGCPRGLAHNKAGHLVVADKDNSRIQVFSSTDRWIGKFGQDVLKRPRGVSVTSDDNIVVCDDSEKTVNVFSPQGVLLLQFSSGTSPHCAIFCDEKYFVSVDGHMIKVFDSRGSHLYDIGQQGNGEGQFDYPAGLAILTDDLLMVCDRNNHRVQVVTLDGEFVTSFGSVGSGLGQFIRPNYISVSPDGRVFVTDRDNHRVQVFQAQY